MGLTETVEIAKWADAKWHKETDLIVAEISTTVHLDQHPVAELHCSPSHLDELAVGHLVTQGLIDPDPGLRKLTVTVTPNQAKAAVMISSDQAGPDCEQATRSRLPVNADDLDPVQILSWIGQLHGQSMLFKMTGGVHSAALAQNEELTVFRQDIGRHNAVDKVIGHGYLQGLVPADYALVLSGRVSAEIIDKAVAAGLRLIVSPSAPTALAVKYAQQADMVLIGFAREHRLSVFSGASRLGIR